MQVKPVKWGVAPTGEGLSDCDSGHIINGFREFDDSFGFSNGVGIYMDINITSEGLRLCRVKEIKAFGLFHGLDWYLTPSGTSQEGGIIAVQSGAMPVIKTAECRFLGNTVKMLRERHYGFETYPKALKAYLKWLDRPVR